MAPSVYVELPRDVRGNERVHVRCPSLVFDFDQNWNPPIEFSKHCSAPNLVKVRTRGSQDRQTYRHGEGYNVFTTFHYERAKSSKQHVRNGMRTPLFQQRPLSLCFAKKNFIFNWPLLCNMSFRNASQSSTVCLRCTCNFGKAGAYCDRIT